MQDREDIASFSILSAAKDIQRNMRTESDAYERDQRTLHDDLWAEAGEDGKAQAVDEREDERMEITGLRSPITINHNYAQPASGQPASQEQPAPAPPEQQPPAAEPAPAWKTWLKRAAIAALPLAGIGGKMAYDAVTAQPPAESGSYLQYHLDVIPPEGNR